MTTLNGERVENLNDGPLREFDIVLIDGMNIAYRSYHTIPVKFNGKKSGLFFGFIRKALLYLKKYPNAEIHVLWEGEGENRRKELLPTYKGNRLNAEHRSEIPNDFQENIADVQAVLPLIGVYQSDYPSLEADDLADYYVNYREPVDSGQKVLLVSNDTDWYTFLLASNNVSIETKTGLVNFSKAVDKLGFEPCKMPLFKSVRGCSTDNVEQAIDRITDARLAEIVNRSDCLDSLISALYFDNQKFNQEMVRVNHSVVSFYGDMINDLPCDLNVREPQLDPDKLSNLLVKWGCFSLREALGFPSLMPQGKRKKVRRSPVSRAALRQIANR